MSNVLITGGAGFIGSHLGNALRQRGDRVYIIDDFNDRYDPRLKEARLTDFLQDFPPSDLYRGDIVDQSFVDNFFERETVDTVVHLAAWAAVQTSLERPQIYAAANLTGTVNVLEAARRHQVKNIVFASSSSVYGGNNSVPFKETDDITRPISPYAATKAAGEILCSTWHHLYGIPITCLRFFTVYGPWGRPEMAIFKFAEAIKKDQPILMRGRHTERDFTYIEDCINGVVAAIDRPNGFAIYNLGESDGVPLPRFINALAQALHKTPIIEEVPLPQGDVPRTLADITLAKQELGYQPRVQIEAGVTKFIDWYEDYYWPRFVENSRAA